MTKPDSADAKAAVTQSAFYAHELPGMPSPRGKREWQNGGICPFHDDRRPNSFHVNLDTGAFRCFACGASGGDVLAFVMQRDGLAFREALQSLCDEWGIL